jgi:hypothetical protein
VLVQDEVSDAGASGGGKRRRRSRSIKNSGLYEKWRHHKHAIYTHFQALSLHQSGTNLKFHSIYRMDNAYVLLDAGRAALSKEAFSDFRKDMRANMFRDDGEECLRLVHLNFLLD